jgi:hypothetical protein
MQLYPWWAAVFVVLVARPVFYSVFHGNCPLPSTRQISSVPKEGDERLKGLFVDAGKKTII